MIKKIKKIDNKVLEKLLLIWLNSNKDSHDFIPTEYWDENLIFVREALPSAEIFVFETDGEILGFLGLVDGYIAGIFVNESSRNLGIGRKLLNAAKKENDKLTLTVFCKNKKAINFYKREEFIIKKQKIDKNTSEEEIVMHWDKNK